MNNIKAYLDTCIISGIVKKDLKPDQQRAMLELLDFRKRGIINMVTSEIANAEIKDIPEEHRYQHQATYLLLSDVPICPICSIYDKGLSGMGIGMGTGAGKQRFNPIYESLKDLLPNEQDANHIYQASKNGIEYFLTSDEETVIKHSNKIKEISGVIAKTPVEFLEIVKSS